MVQGSVRTSHFPGADSLFEALTLSLIEPVTRASANALEGSPIEAGPMCHQAPNERKAL